MAAQLCPEVVLEQEVFDSPVKSLVFNLGLSKAERIQENYGVTQDFLQGMKEIVSRGRSRRSSFCEPREERGRSRCLSVSPPRDQLEAAKRSAEETENIIEESKGNEPGELEMVWQYLDEFYEVEEESGSILGARNSLEINVEGMDGINTTPEFVQDILNSSGNVVILEFFTHCCINCIHSIADVRTVYGEIMEGVPEARLSVVSVHSPKFAREKETASLQSFVDQLQMGEYSLVLNDKDCRLWNELGIFCWPTLVVLGPNPREAGMNLLFTLSGEGHRNVLKILLSSTLQYLNRKLAWDSLPSKDVADSARKLTKSRTDEGLRFPGKVTVYQQMLAVADTGNHRIIVMDTTGVVKAVVGGGKKGFSDGNFHTAKFLFPQGLVFKNESTLIVADTGNHAVREIDLNLKCVRTLLRPGFTIEVANEMIHLRSPWDLTFFSDNVLLIAGAGNHRVFAFFFDTATIFSSEYAKGTLTLVAGTGNEENRNNSYILKASFAQPSGICVLTHDATKTIFIADSESSSIRCITTEGKGKVCGVVGGAKDPKDLFTFGDQDGKSVNAKLQHPMGVCADSMSGNVYFVDTYNNKVKSVDVKTNVCSTISGTAAPGDQLGDAKQAQFNEPGGICINSDDQKLYIADTNNHAIKILDLHTMDVTKVAVKLPSRSGNISYNGVFLVPKEATSFSLQILKIPSNFEESHWALSSLQQTPNPTNGPIKRNDNGTGEIAVSLPDGLPLDEYILTANIFLCGASTCFKRSLTFLIKRDSTSSSRSFTYEPETSFFNEQKI